MTTPVRFAYAHPDASRSEGSLLAYLPITLRHDTHVLTGTGLLDTGSTVNVLPIPPWSAAGLCVGTTADTSTLDGESCETAGARGDRLRPSGIVSAGRSRVCLDAVDRGANDPGTSQLFHGIRCVLFPIARSF